MAVAKSDRFPYRTIGLIETDDATCTGTIIGPRQILTAAHCLIDVQKTRTWKTNPYFYPGRNDIADLPYETLQITRAYVPKAYLDALQATDQSWALEVDDGSRTNLSTFVFNTLMLDYAIAEVDQPIGDKTGWIGISEPDSQAAPSVQLVGYPIDKGRYGQWFSICQSRWDEARLEHRCDMAPGMSGAAALVRAFDDSYAASALYTAGSPQVNYLIPFNGSVMAQLRLWRNGKTDTNTEMHDFSHEKAYSIRLANQCDRAIRAVVHYRNSQGQWVTSNWLETASRQMRTLVSSSSPVFYLYAETAGVNTIHFEGTDLKRKIGNSPREYNLRKITIGDERFVPFVYPLSCP